MNESFEVPWVEKYRPETLDSVISNEETLCCLKAMAQEGNMPNLILSGPPGTGKTSSILCLARQLLQTNFKNAVLELNASNDRGIDTVRTKIKMFAQQKISLPIGRHKIVLLDEADSMTTAAQQALRRTMEIYSSTTRFALACNTSTKIIEPIQSRCAILRFTRLGDEPILNRLLFICEREKVLYENDGLSALLFTADGDMRNAINNLQATFAGFGAIKESTVLAACDQPHPNVVRRMLQKCIEKDLKSAEQEMMVLVNGGYAILDLIETVFRVCKGMEMDETLRLDFVKEIGVCHMCIAEGLTSTLQLHGLLARLCALENRI